MKLSAAQNAALAALKVAAAGGSVDGTVHQGWGHNLRAMRSLESLGLATVEVGEVGGYVRNGRWLKPRHHWTARITHEGLCRVTIDESGAAS